MATTAAGALRGLAFAIEADRLLRHGTAAPTGMQLAEADEARRARSTELSAALVEPVRPHRLGAGRPEPVGVGPLPGTGPAASRGPTDGRLVRP